jgi:hypothetical protein
MHERIRVWTENIETFTEDVVFHRRQGVLTVLARPFLWAMSRLYMVVARFRRF